MQSLQAASSLVAPADSNITAWLSKFPPNTARAYRKDLTLFLDFAKGNPLSDGPAVVRTMQSWVASMSGLSPATRARRVAAVKSFVGFLAGSGVVPNNPTKLVPTPKVNNGPRTTLDPSEVRRMLEAPDRTTPLGKRDYCLLLWLAELGIRRTELASLHYRNLTKDPKGRAVVCFTSKGGRERSLPVSKQAIRALEDYRVAVQMAVSDLAPLFLTADGAPISDNAVYDAVRRAAEDAEIGRDISPHAFRHFAITEAAMVEDSPEKLRRFSGHRSATTLARYIHFQDHDVVEGIQRKRGIV